MRRNNSSPHGDMKGKIVISFISFIVGLQARNVLDLFSSTYNYELSTQSSGNYNNGAWAPQVSQLDRRNANAARKSRASRYAESNRLGATKNASSDTATDAPTMAPKPKRQKEIPRFNRENFTETSEPLLWSLPTRGHSDLPSADEFMKSYIAEKRRLGKDIPWEKPLGDEQNVKLPLPIIGLNFPKSATLTLKEFFKCGGLTAIHTSTQQGRISICMRENLLAGNPPLHGCNYHKSKKTRKIEPIDFISDIGTQFPCFYSSLHDGGLEAIAEHYPHATIMLVTRNAKSWHRSMSKWGSILKHWQNRCGFDGNLNYTKSDYWHQRWINSPRKKEDYWIDFYNAHTQKIRDFAIKNPSLTYVEVELEDESMANKMEYYSGVPSTCVMDCHPGPNWIREHPNVTGRCLPIGGISQSARIQDNSRGRDWTDDDDETGDQR